MADLEFNKQDIENLAQKLATLWGVFQPTRTRSAAGHLRDGRGQG